jgi:hypothetical protein
LKSGDDEAGFQPDRDDLGHPEAANLEVGADKDVAELRDFAQRAWAQRASSL